MSSALVFQIWTAACLLMLLFVLLKYGNLKIGFGLLAFIAIWAVYIGLLVDSGVLEDFGMPPRVPLLVVIPVILLTIIITGFPFFRSVLQRTPLYLPVALQSFRIVVELCIYWAFLDGVFPERVTFEGLNFDVLAGLSAPIMAYLFAKEKISRKTLKIWNILALGILSLTVFSFVSYYYMGNADITTQFVDYPYILLASFLLPTAIFLHVFSLRQLNSGIS